MSDKVEFDATCIQQTTKAIRVRIADREEPIWVPQSLVDEDSEVYKLGQSGKLVLPEWWCIKEELV